MIAALMIVLCLCIKSEILSLLCIMIASVCFLLKIAKENPHNWI